jgi:hypothetical protein
VYLTAAFNCNREIIIRWVPRPPLAFAEIIRRVSCSRLVFVLRGPAEPMRGTRTLLLIIPIKPPAGDRSTFANLSSNTAVVLVMRAIHFKGDGAAFITRNGASTGRVIASLMNSSCCEENYRLSEPR